MCVLSARTRARTDFIRPHIILTLNISNVNMLLVLNKYKFVKSQQKRRGKIVHLKAI